MAIELAERTYLPEQDADLDPVLNFLSSHEDRRGALPLPRYVLADEEADERVDVPAQVHSALRQIVEALLAGRAVTVMPHNLSLTTQQAADLLGISRPTVLKLIKNGELECERISNRRTLRLSDVLEYRERRRQQQYAVLLADSADFDEEDPQKLLKELKETRRVVAAKRRSKAADLA